MNNFGKMWSIWLVLVLVNLVIQIIGISQPTLAAATIYFDLVIDESRQLLYGSDRDNGKIDIISIKTLSRVDSVNVGSQPTGLDISPDGNELAVALYGQSEIVFIDLSTLVVTDRLVPAGTHGLNRPFDALYGRPGRLYSVGNPGSNGFDYVHAFDTLNKLEVGRSTYIIRAAPRLAITADYNNLYVSSVIFSPQNIHHFDISTDTPVWTARGPHGPVHVNTLAVKPDGSQVYSSRGQIWSGDLATQLGSFSPGSSEIEHSDTLHKFFITYESQVNEYDANSYALLRQFNLCRSGGVARVNAAGTFLYVSTSYGIEEVDLITGENRICNNNSQFCWSTFIPAIIGGSCKISSFWGAYSIVCCRSSSATLSVTISGNTKQSYKPGCGIDATWEGWQRSPAGKKTVNWRVSSPTCGTYSGTFPWVMERGKVYLFRLELRDRTLVIYVYSGDACDIVQNAQVSTSPSSLEHEVEMETGSLKLVDTIEFDISADTQPINDFSADTLRTVP